MLRYICDECDAKFIVHYELDEDFYEVHFCPFCSAQIDKIEEIEETNNMDPFPNVDI